MLRPVIDWKELWGKRGFKAAVIGLCTVFVLSGVGVAGYYLWPEPAPKPPPPVQTATTQEAREYLASEDFKRLPLEQRSEWMEQARGRMAQMDDEERRNLWQNTDEETRRRIGENMREMMMERMTRDVETYHSLPVSEREAFLDKKIDEMESRGWGGPGMGRGPGGPRGDRPRDGQGQARSGDRGGRPEGFRGGPGAPGGPPAGARRGPRGGPGGFMARMPADKRAEFLAYRKAMMKRRMERGLGGPGGPGGRR